MRYKRLLTDEEYQEIIKKMDGHDREIRNKSIDEFAETLKNHLNQFDFWQFNFVASTGAVIRNYDYMIDEIAEELKEGV